MINQLNNFGLNDILKSAATKHCNNAEIIPINENALKLINPSAESLIGSVNADINSEKICRTIIKRYNSEVNIK